MPNLNRAFAQIKMTTPINSTFDVYMYADISGKEWLGVAVVLNFVNNTYFPAGLSVAQGFDKGSDGNNQIWGAFFGPKADSNGNMLVPGGIALFANALSLIEGSSVASASSIASVGGTSRRPTPSSSRAPTPPTIRRTSGPRHQVGEAFEQIMNANTYGKSLITEPGSGCSMKISAKRFSNVALLRWPVRGVRREPVQPHAAGNRRHHDPAHERHPLPFQGRAARTRRKTLITWAAWPS